MVFSNWTGNCRCFLLEFLFVLRGRQSHWDVVLNYQKQWLLMTLLSCRDFRFAQWFQALEHVSLKERRYIFADLRFLQCQAINPFKRKKKKNHGHFFFFLSWIILTMTEHYWVRQASFLKWLFFPCDSILAWNFASNSVEPSLSRCRHYTCGLMHA